MVQPKVQAILVADHIYIDKNTNKKIIAGIFDRMYLIPPPAGQEVSAEDGKIKINIPPGGHRASSPFCYINLIDIRKQEHFELRYVDLEDDRVVFGTNFNINADNPLQSVEIVIPLPLLPAEKAGVFALELIWNDISIGSHRIIVETITPSQD